jgi:hypothetical protein
MSWFNRRPRAKEPVKALTPYRTSPAIDRALEQAKKLGPKSLKNKSKNTHRKTGLSCMD